MTERDADCGNASAGLPTVQTVHVHRGRQFGEAHQNQKAGVLTRV